MIKSLLIEQKFYDRCLSQKSTNYGLIISGAVKEDECIFLLLTSIAKDLTTIDSIDASELKLDCQKICRMLPAGSRVSGVYYCGSLSFSKSSARIKEILKVIHLAEKHPLTDKFVPLTDRDKVFLHMDPITKSFIAKAIGFEHPKDFLRPVDVKVRQVMDRWRAIKTYVNLSLEAYLPAERQKEKILQQLEEAAIPFLETVTSKARLLVDGDLRDESDLIFRQRSTAKTPRQSKRHKVAKAELDSFSEAAQNLSNNWDSSTFALFGPDFLSWKRTNSNSSIDSGHCSDAFAMPIDSSPRPEGDKSLTIHGRIPGLAFLPVDGTTVADALKAFQRDLTHSILVRLELLTEELQISSGEVECGRILLPSRVLVRIPACPAFPLSDYKFVSETPDDVVRRVALFCRPLGSANPPAFMPASGGISSGDRLSAADSGECSSDSEFNATDVDVEDDAMGTEEVVILSLDNADQVDGNEDEPVFDVACLDTELERTFDGGNLCSFFLKFIAMSDLFEVF
ncbi:unnamed protein product [Hydatigera taeniaeformis]|uniref:ULP_PROTEASE domain-containing protein n=1 Tax=Hydatigena taeniaeformis TaxID=6205 RepID=A0A0R3WJQ1_HYDTA|nr:unnamed protein product [Hydatigera taeniaeformis]